MSLPAAKRVGWRPSSAGCCSAMLSVKPVAGDRPLSNELKLYEPLRGHRGGRITHRRAKETLTQLDVGARRGDDGAARIEQFDEHVGNAALVAVLQAVACSQRAKC